MITIYVPICYFVNCIFYLFSIKLETWKEDLQDLQEFS